MRKYQKTKFKTLASLLKLIGWTQVDLATYLGISESTINSRMVGKSNWNLPEIQKIREKFNKPVEDIFFSDMGTENLYGEGNK